MGDVQLLAFRGAPHEVGLFDVGTGRAELNRTSTILFLLLRLAPCGVSPSTLFPQESSPSPDAPCHKRFSKLPSNEQGDLWLTNLFLRV